MTALYGNPLLGPGDVGLAGYTTWLKQQLRAKDPVLLTALLGPDTALVWREAPYPEILQKARAAMQLRLPNRPFSGTYAGIGSRSTPDAVLGRMARLATRLAKRGFRLRSGAAAGADSAFASSGVLADIFLPWPRFRGHPSPLSTPTPEAFAVAALVHPAWHSLSPVAQKLMARNSHQVLGRYLRQPADFVVCWTEDGCESLAERGRSTGGTGQAIDLADRFGIPVFNLAREDAVERLAALVRHIAPVLRDAATGPSIQ